MPLYDYFCGDCNRTFEKHTTINNRNKVKCEKCGELAELFISCHSKPQVHEYYSENLNAKVTGPAQKRRLMKEKGLEEV